MLLGTYYAQNYTGIIGWCLVLPSMRKDCDYIVTILIHESTACVVYNCPAGISATLYCLEDYINVDYRMMNERYVQKA